MLAARTLSRLAQMSLQLRPSSRMGFASDAEPDMLHRKEQGARLFVLNRPRAFNALTLDMIRNITPQLQAWEQSDLCNVIILKSSSEKAFCAGGDVKDLVLKIQSNKHTDAVRFFFEEYQLNHYIATTPKPFVALMDGITMGGGVGLSVHAPFRVASEKTLFAMPETAIGLFPDVGGTFMLPRLDGQLGTYLALTGERLKGADVFTAGIATHYVPSERMDDLEQRLYEVDSPDWSVVNSAIEEFAEPADIATSALLPNREIIDRCFAHNTIEAILNALQQDGSPFALKTAALLKNMSPTSLKTTLRQVREGAKLDLAAAFRLEWTIANNITRLPDFTQGVSAKLFTKPPSTPRWNPASISQVNDKLVDSIFTSPSTLAPLPLLRPTTYQAYPHRLLALPKEEDVRRVISGGQDKTVNNTGQSNSDTSKPTSFDSANNVAQWFGDNWPTQSVIQACMNDYIELKRTADKVRGEQKPTLLFKRVGSGKVGVVEHVRAIVERYCTVQDGQVQWKSQEK